jgi:hypothetical protein
LRVASTRAERTVEQLQGDAATPGRCGSSARAWRSPEPDPETCAMASSPVLLDRRDVAFGLAAALGGVLFFLPARAVEANELWRWVDRGGTTHYSDRVPPQDARDVRQRRLPASVAGSVLPYELREAVREHPVTLYTFDCGAPCADARALLVLRGVPHTAKDASDASVQEEMRRVAGSTGAPLLVVGHVVQQGWDVAAWQQALDAARYPKSPRTAQAAAEASAMRRQRGDLPVPPLTESPPPSETPVMPPVMPDRADNLETRSY